MGGLLGSLTISRFDLHAQPAARKSIVDVHHHYLPPAYLKQVPDIEASGMGPLRGWTAQRSLEQMDEAGVTTAMLSVVTGGTMGLRFSSVEAARQLARECNEHGAHVVREHRGRFGLFAALPLPDVEGSLQEIEHALDVLEAGGVALYTSYGNQWLGDPEFAPVMQELNRRKAVVYTHPGAPACCIGLKTGAPPPAIEFGTDTARTIASLLANGTAVRYPDIKFIFSHAGGVMPFLIERFEMWGKAPAMIEKNPDGVLAELRRFYYDTAQSSNPVALGALKQVVPVSQILFGTDFPFRAVNDHVQRLRGSGVFDQEALIAIEGANARRLLSLM